MVIVRRAFDAKSAGMHVGSKLPAARPALFDVYSTRIDLYTQDLRSMVVNSLRRIITKRPINSLAASVIFPIPHGVFHY